MALPGMRSTSVHPHVGPMFVFFIEDPLSFLLMDVPGRSGQPHAALPKAAAHPALTGDMNEQYHAALPEVTAQATENGSSRHVAESGSASRREWQPHAALPEAAAQAALTGDMNEQPHAALPKAAAHPALTGDRNKTAPHCISKDGSASRIIKNQRGQRSSLLMRGAKGVWGSA